MGGQRDAIIQATLDANRLANAAGYILAIHYGLTERRIGRRQDQRHQHDGPDAHRVEHQYAEARAEKHGDR